MEGTSQVSARLLKVDYGPMYADAHCHLEMFDDPEGTVAMAKGSGVGMIITAGSDARSNVRILELAKDGVYGVVGICPEFAERDFAHIGDLGELIRMNRNIVGLGEIGLDETITEVVGMDRQEEAFRKQLDLAKEMELPVVIHARKALGRTMDILKEMEMDRVMFHYFEGGEEEARAAEKRGWLVSIPPVESGRRRRVIKEVELSSIVAETDSPAVGASPSDVVKVIGRIAGLKGIGTEDAGERITKTIKEYFYI